MRLVTVVHCYHCSVKFKIFFSATEESKYKMTHYLVSRRKKGVSLTHFSSHLTFHPHKEDENI